MCDRYQFPFVNQHPEPGSVIPYYSPDTYHMPLLTRNTSRSDGFPLDYHYRHLDPLYVDWTALESTERYEFNDYFYAYDNLYVPEDGEVGISWAMSMFDSSVWDNGGGNLQSVQANLNRGKYVTSIQLDPEFWGESSITLGSGETVSMAASPRQQCLLQQQFECANNTPLQRCGGSAPGRDYQGDSISFGNDGSGEPAQCDPSREAQNGVCRNTCSCDQYCIRDDRCCIDFCGASEYPFNSDSGYGTCPPEGLRGDGCAESDTLNANACWTGLGFGIARDFATTHPDFQNATVSTGNQVRRCEATGSGSHRDLIRVGGVYSLCCF